MELSTINHRICLVKYVKQNLAIDGPTLQLCSLIKTPLCFKNFVFRKNDKLGSKPARFVDKWFRQDLSKNGKTPCERKLHHKKNNQHVYWVAFIFDFCWETHVVFATFVSLEQHLPRSFQLPKLQRICPVNRSDFNSWVDWIDWFTAYGFFLPSNDRGFYILEVS